MAFFLPDLSVPPFFLPLKMAQPLPIQGRFGYRTVHLVKTEDNSLGIGSYGAVYKARCDQLPCAAKVLHPILFSTRDPASRRIVERFEQECEFLSGMRHPNITQYLGTCRDPDTGLPILLTELMDESLTSFLERPDDPPPLPFHIQVNISLDVAQALAYLHSNEVLHRDLSSNNVLLIGSSRAKVTDFGMAKVVGTNPHLTATYCPGTMGYMSPEALRESPAYTTKLDIFSCGVLHIQILTRKFPDPGPRVKVVDLNDPRLPSSEVEIRIPERERRRSHIDLIDPTHPLLRIALDCLKDKEDERPSAEHLCSHLAALKETSRYQKGLQQAQQTAQTLHDGTEAQLEPQRELLQHNQEHQQQLVEREETAQAQEREVDGLVRSIEQLQLQSQEKETQLQQKEREIQQSQIDNRRLRDEVRQKEEQVEQLRHVLLQTSRDSEQLVATLQQKDEVIRSKDAVLQEKERQIRELRQSQRDRRGSGTSSQAFMQQWRGGPRAPLETFGETSAVNGRVAYFYSWKENKIMMYNSETGKWAILPECPNTDFAIAMVKGLFTTIGGKQSSDNKHTKTLLSLKTSRVLLRRTEQQKWTKTYPPMVYYHESPAVACTSTSLIVAGGWGPDEKQAPVEAMDTNTLHWSTVASLPHPWGQTSATLCGDRMYIAGGFVEGDQSNSVMTCFVSELLQSTATQCQPLGARPTAASGLQPSIDSHNVWQEVAPLPVYRSSLVTLRGQVLAVGGCDLANNPTSAVYQYDTATNSWKLISRMSNNRYVCFTAVLPDNTLLVAGGVVKEYPSRYTDSVEIASCT